MLNFKYLRTVLVAAALTALTLPSGANPHLMKGGLEEASIVDAGVAQSVSATPALTAASSTFYSLRRDLRRCISPLCGGYFVKRVNATSTRCADGQFKPECYVAEVDRDIQLQPENDLLVRGSIVARRYEQFGNLGELRVSESWRPLGAKKPVGTFYLVRDRKVRCIAFPCPTHREAKLNSSFSRNIAGVNLDAAGLKDDNLAIVKTAMIGPDGLVVAGENVPVKGPGGRSFEIRASQVYVRNKPDGSSRPTDSGSLRPCFKTGCSSQVCADHNVITTCEFRSEYACFQKATCERQADGNCGFTKTPELTACLAKK